MYELWWWIKDKWHDFVELLKAYVDHNSDDDDKWGYS